MTDPSGRFRVLKGDEMDLLERLEKENRQLASALEEAHRINEMNREEYKRELSAALGEQS